MLKATNCAALPISLAFFDSACFSKDIRSTTASIAELNNSTISASKQTAIINACSTRDTSSKKLLGMRTTFKNVICRKAASLKNAALKPDREYEVALIMRFKPVEPLKGE